MTPETAIPLTPVHQIFVDFENVHDVDLAIIGAKNIRLTILIGSRQTKLDVALVERLLNNAASVELIRLESSGANALDFVLAYYLGRAAIADPAGQFHIISKDKGYDPLIEHLLSRNIRVRRHNDYSAFSDSKCVPDRAVLVDSSDLFSAARVTALRTTPAAAVSKSKSPTKSKAKAKLQAPGVAATSDHREQRLLTHFRKPTTTRPRTRARLLSFLTAYFARKLTETEVSNLVENLSQAGHLIIDEKERVTYRL